MKFFSQVLFPIMLLFMLTSCGFHNGLTANLNNHNTEVVLSQNNYKVIESVRGEASARYIFGIGGTSKKALIADARAEMLKNVNLVGSSKAIINETVEIQNARVFFANTYTVTVSAYVIEFN